MERKEKEREGKGRKGKERKGKGWKGKDREETARELKSVSSPYRIFHLEWKPVEDA